MNQSSARSSTSKEVMIIEEDDLVSRQMWERIRYGGDH